MGTNMTTKVTYGVWVWFCQNVLRVNFHMLHRIRIKDGKVFLMLWQLQQNQHHLLRPNNFLQSFALSFLHGIQAFVFVNHMKLSLLFLDQKISYFYSDPKLLKTSSNLGRIWILEQYILLHLFYSSSENFLLVMNWLLYFGQLTERPSEEKLCSRTSGIIDPSAVLYILNVD